MIVWIQQLNETLVQGVVYELYVYIFFLYYIYRTFRALFFLWLVLTFVVAISSVIKNHNITGFEELANFWNQFLCWLLFWYFSWTLELDKIKVIYSTFLWDCRSVYASPSFDRYKYNTHEYNVFTISYFFLCVVENGFWNCLPCKRLRRSFSVDNTYRKFMYSHQTLSYWDKFNNFSISFL